MPIVAIAGEKGGAGKSTVAVCIADELLVRGHRVVVADADPQGTVRVWAQIAAEAGHQAPRVLALGDGLRSELPGIAEAADWTIVDLPGRVAARTVGAALVADVLLLPCTPSPADVWALASALDTLAPARQARPDLRCRILLTRADRSAVGAASRAALADVDAPVLTTTLGDRVAYREAVAAGRGVTRHAPSSRAASEVRALVDELERLVKPRKRRNRA